MGFPRTKMWCAENLTYVRPGSVIESPVCVWSVTGSLLFGSPLGPVRGVLAQDTSWIVLVCRFRVVDYYVVQRGFASGRVPLLLLPGTFFGLDLNLGSDRLYDLIDDIADVMGLRALRPSAAICKVMSVPDSRFVQVVTPDEHVNIGLHEIIIHDLADEE